jgi:uncharacterized protein (TIGR04442 family)
MLQDVTLHGFIGRDIEYFATIAGRDLAHRYFYETEGEEGDFLLRFFTAGCEFAFLRNGIRYSGPGGSVCDYMFGANQPVADLVKKEVLNRLVMFGARYGEDHESLVFSNNLRGQQDYRRVFLDGNAVTNYFFFIPAPYEGRPRERQEWILRRVGKALKRSPRVQEGRDSDLAHLLADALGEPDTIVYLFRIVHRGHQRYREAFEKRYLQAGTYTETLGQELEGLAEELGVEPYQRQRIRMDVVYKQAENRKLVETYKDVLVGCTQEGLTESNRARLQRLRSLSIRHNVPSSLLDMMDQMILGMAAGTAAALHADEADYVARTREILESLFLGNGDQTSAHTRITAHDIREILKAKMRATDEHNNLFEQVLLDTGRACDEMAAETGQIVPLENFGNIVTYLDRFDSTLSHLNRLAFMDDARLDEDKVRSLLNNKREFDALEAGMFETLFVAPVVRNKYVPVYGRRKAAALLHGLRRVEDGAASLGDVERDIAALAKEEYAYRHVRAAVKSHIRNFYYSDLRSRDSLEGLRRDISAELQLRRVLRDEVSEALFHAVILDVQKEAIYVQQILPQVIDRRDPALREDFIVNSGLDRFYIEELENSYLRAAEIDESVLASVREAVV